MRNKSCKFLVGLIPDKPFTNYARDIYEKHLAYRTLNDDDTYMIKTRQNIRVEIAIFTIFEPFPGKFTSLRFQIMYWFTIQDALIDGEPKCEYFLNIPLYAKIIKMFINQYQTFITTIKIFF